MRDNSYLLHKDASSIRSGREAVASVDAKQWQAAAHDEMTSLIKASVFCPVPRSAARVVSSKWVFKVKRQSDGSIERYKARLVARGFSQKPGIDYDETFAPVAKFQSIRLLLALAAMHDLELHQMGVKTAFLYGSLEELVFMEQPEGFERGKGMVWQLNKALYGLKQSPRAWYKELDAALKSLGFTRTISDHSIYVRNSSEGLIIVGVYVDDLTIAAANVDTLARFKTEMSKRYEMKDLGELHFILGLQVKRDRLRAIHLSHTGTVSSQSSSISSTRAILESPTLGGANSSMATVMQTLPPAMSIDVESPVAMSSDYGGELLAGSQRNSHRSRSLRAMQNMLPSLRPLES